MSATSRILIEYGTSLRAVCAQSLFEMSLTHWLSSGSVTITFVSVICLSYSLPMLTSVEVGSASTGAGMVALSIAILSAMTTMRRNGMTGVLGAVGRSGPGSSGSTEARNSPLVTYKAEDCVWTTELSR